MDYVAQDGSKYVFPQTGDKKNDIIHFHNLAAHKKHDTKRDVPGRYERSVININDKTFEEKLLE